MVTSNLHIPLRVLKVSEVNDICLSVYFDRPKGFTYEPGDWMDVNFPDGNPSGGRTYSFSSSPTEDMLAITFKVGISPFKKRLQSLCAGDEMFISQYGNDYGFYLKGNRSSVLIAGGIGIAPFRSMLKEMSDKKSRDDVQLVYLNKDNDFIFAEEINTWQKQLPQLRVDYVVTGDLSRKKREKLLINLVRDTAHYYYIAGPEGMVESVEHLLIDELRILPKYLRIDSFGGY